MIKKAYTPTQIIRLCARLKERAQACQTTELKQVYVDYWHEINLARAKARTAIKQGDSRLIQIWTVTSYIAPKRLRPHQMPKSTGRRYEINRPLYLWR